MQKTPLFDRHQALGATIVDFGGWAMPVQYTNVIEEHNATRGQAGLFDICHMGEFEVSGPQAFDLLQWVMSRNLEGQKPGQVKLSTMTNERGGIVDDLTVYKKSEESYMIVTNAGTKDKDFAWIQKAKEDKGFESVQVRDISSTTGKLDLQGPEAEEILAKLVEDDLAAIRFYHFIETRVLGIPAIVSRSGYTGEEGFEIYLPWDETGRVWDELLTTGESWGLVPVGLGARDTLRLECGMNLYGHEINEDITPFEARYGWVTDLDKDFIGSEVLRRQSEQGPDKKLVGFEMIERGIAREHYPITMDLHEIGQVSSGTFCPTVGKAVGLGHVQAEFAGVGTEIQIQIRNKFAQARIVKLPFYKRDQ